MQSQSYIPRVLRLVVCIGAGVAALVFARGQRLTVQPDATEQRIAILDSVSPRTLRAESLGRLSGDTALTRMALSLRTTEAQEADLEHLLADQQDPASPSYHQWLTAKQFGTRFGVSDDELDVLQRWLQTRGFTVESLTPGRNSVVFSGTASAAEQAFGVTLQRYRLNGREYFENSTAIRLPASLATVVSGVSGLSSYRLLAPRLKRANTSAIASPQYTTSTGSHYLLPWDFRQIYGINSLMGAGYDGHGVTIAVLGQSAVDTAQLTYFQQKTGQTVKLPTMVLVPLTSASAKVAEDEAESELDLEYASANAPGASVQFIYTGCASASTGDCNNNGVFDALGYAIRNNLAQVLSVSYGGCEADDATYALSTIEPLLQQANAQGQTVVVASGDGGPANCEQSITATHASAGLAVSYPASSPYVTAIGGTQLSSDNFSYWSTSNNAGNFGSATGYMPEAGWNDTATYGALMASGGGVSKIFPKPRWQAGNGVPQDGQRDVPDLAFAANVSEHAYLICDADEPCLSGTTGFVVGRDGGAVGGTSASTPNFAAMLALIEQANGGRALGNINPGLYGLAAAANASSMFHDITTGNNVVPCVTGSVDCSAGSLGYSAGPGYDLVTGLGSVSGAALQPALQSYAATVATVSLNASPSTVNVGAPVAFTATVSGSGPTPNGTMTFAVDGGATGQVVTLVSGIATYNYGGFAISGGHTISATYSGDNTYRAGTASLTVTASTNQATISMTSAPIHPVSGSSVIFAATLSGNAGTPTGTVSFFLDSALTVAVLAPVSNGVATFSYAGFSAAGLHTISATYSGNTTYSSASATLPLTVGSSVQPLASSVKVSVNPSTTSVGSAVTIATAVTGSGPVPKGTVSYTIDGTPGSSGTLASGAASFTYAGFSTAGIHIVQATYSGDSNYSGGTASVSVVVTAPSITLSLNSTSLTVISGSSGSLTATVASQNGFAGTVGLTLSLVSSTGATFSGCYSLSPAAVTTAAGASVMTSVTVFTSNSSCTGSGTVPLARSAAAAQARDDGRHSPPVPRSSLIVLSAGLLGCAAFWRRRMSSCLMLLIMVLAPTSFLQGCGSGIAPSTAATVTTPASPASTSSTKGTYVIQVTATSASSAAVTASAQFTLSLQ